MNTFDNLKSQNPSLEIYSVHDRAFESYGRVIDGISADGFASAALEIPMPTAGSAYVPSVPAFEALSDAEKIKNQIFGTLPTQIGYCYGKNSMMNATEWHASSEVNIALTDLVLLLSHVWQIKEGWTHSSDFKAFFVPKGTVIEVFATSLHFCPCEVSDGGFGCVVALPEGTNFPLSSTSEDGLLFRRNKWLLAHVENVPLIEKGAKGGIFGENIKIKC